MDTQEFIQKNNLKLQTQEAILKKLNEVKKSALAFDFRPEVLINYLSFENAKPYLQEEYVKKVDDGTEKWETISTLDKCVSEFLDYMKFAWGKAEDQRGLSASRSVQKLGMWLWLMDREDLNLVINDDALYNPYGAPALIEVCNQMGIPVPSSLIEFAKEKC